MPMKKQERKEEYSSIIGLMLKGENKQAFDKLACMCGVDTGLFIMADYDKEMLKLSSSKLKEGDEVSYHCFAGGDVSSTGHVIKSIELQPNNYGEDVAFITGKSGCVSIDNLTKV